MQCPICSVSFPRKDIVEHVQIHFGGDDDPLRQDGETSRPEARPDEGHRAPKRQHGEERRRQEDDFDGMAIVCAVCGADVPLADAERHEQLHVSEQQEQLHIREQQRERDARTRRWVLQGGGLELPRGAVPSWNLPRTRIGRPPLFWCS